MEPSTDKTKINPNTKTNTEEKVNPSKATKNVKWQMHAKSFALEAGGVFLNGILFGLGSLAAKSLVDSTKSAIAPKLSQSSDNIVQMRRQHVGHA